MIYFVLVGILAIGWDLYSFYKWPKHDYTVSGFVYFLTHRWPIIAVMFGGLLVYYFPTSIIPMIAGGMVVHFVWKA